MLQVQNVAFDYEEKPLLNNITFSVNPGDILHLRGDNGAGKSTLLRLLAGFLQPHSGKILFEGHSIHEMKRQYQGNLCYLGHKLGVNPDLTVGENASFDLHIQQFKNNAIDFKRFNLLSLQNTRCKNLSMGQQRKIALLRLGMSRAKLWLLDEPFVSLDKNSCHSLLTLFTRHLEHKGSIILVSHQDIISSLLNYREYILC